MAGYHFGDEDYVILNGSIGIGLGLSGGLIMDRMDNIYFVRGGGIVNGLGGTVATGKLSVDTSGWKSQKFRDVLSGSSTNFSLSLFKLFSVSLFSFSMSCFRFSLSVMVMVPYLCKLY